MVASTIRAATGNVAAAFWDQLQQSPLHVNGEKAIRPSITSLLKAFENLDPPPKRQKALTPKLLREMYKLSGAGLVVTDNTAQAACADLAIMAFFFAMRSCEYTTVCEPGRTKTLDVQHVVFRDSRKRIIPQDSPEANVEYVTVTFVDQKNGDKMDMRTQGRTGDPVLCPVKRLHALVSRIRHNVPHHSGSTTINTIHIAESTLRVTNSLLLKQIRSTCDLCGGHKTFGFHSTDIGTHSLRSGGAMALFLNDHPVHKIMIFGRWSSDAFLAYIRPQVLERTNNMSTDMIRHDSFLDASDSRRTHNEDPRLRRQIHGPSIFVPRLALFH
jgi:hypothetical protein